jgi:chromate transporter
MAAQSEPGKTPAIGPPRLFIAFLQVGLSGFGGVLPFARRMLVERQGWLTEESFNETLAFCQSLPGPNIVNMSIVVGSRFAGPRGALAALAGLVVAPMLIVMAAGTLWDRFAAAPRLAEAVTGLGAAAAGLVAATAVKMAFPLLRRRPLVAAPVVAAAFVAVGVMSLPLPGVLAVLAPVSVAAAWFVRP